MVFAFSKAKSVCPAYIVNFTMIVYHQKLLSVKHTTSPLVKHANIASISLQHLTLRCFQLDMSLLSDPNISYILVPLLISCSQD